MDPNLDWQTYQAQIQKLERLDYNYDEKMYHDAKDKAGWYIDSYRATLAVEAKGPVVPGGPFEAAKNAILLYKFPDPRLIRAVFNPQSVLAGRNMLMFAKFAGLTFTFGVRVTAVIDELRDGGQQQVWGYAYRTLKGHFEIGEIRFEVSKNLLTGEVAFAMNAYSRPDQIPNLFYRTGFRIFGRTLQKYFAHSSIRRLQKVAAQSLK